MHALFPKPRPHGLSIAFCVLSLLLAACNAAPPGKTPRLKFDEEHDSWFHYRTRPDLQAPRWDITVYDQQALKSPGSYWFIAPYDNIDNDARAPAWVGAYIYDQMGELVWAAQPVLGQYKIFDLKVSQVNGTDVLSLIYPFHNTGAMFNDRYEITQEVLYTEDAHKANMHDFNLVANGQRALVLTQYFNKRLSKEFSATLGWDGECSVHEDGIREYDLTTSPPRLTFEWFGMDHIAIQESGVTGSCKSNWDIHHFNAIDKFPDGDFLLSARSTDTIYKISHVDGSIVWRLGGVKSDFDIPSDIKFSRQHHSRVISQDSTQVIISLFDNAKGTDGGNQATAANSRGLILALNLVDMTVSLLFKADHPEGALVDSRGSLQPLPNGNVFMGWTYHTRISEHGPDGRLLMHAALKKNIHTYRAYKFPWIGHPTSPPTAYSAAFVLGANVSTMAYVSWNGATEVARWRLYDTDVYGEQRSLLNSTERQGFETAVTYEGFAKYIVFEALDQYNNVLGTSRVTKTLPPPEGLDKLNASDYQWADDEEILHAQLSEALAAGVRAAESPASFFAVGCVSSMMTIMALYVLRRAKMGRLWRPTRSRPRVVVSKYHTYSDRKYTDAGFEETFSTTDDGEGDGYDDVDGSQLTLVEET